MSYTIGQIAALLGLEYQGDGTRLLTKVAKWEAADDKSLIFIQDGEPDAIQTGDLRAGCVISKRGAAPAGANVLFSGFPKLDFARAAAYLHPQAESCGIKDSTAWVHPECEIGNNVEIGPFVVIEAGARVGDGSILKAGTVIGKGAQLGKNCVLYPGVTLYPDTRIGDRVILHAGVVVGSDGFGYVPDGERHQKFPQVGSVVLEDDVEIGCNTTIDRGSLGTTRIGRGTKIDNLVQIAHNVEIGRHVIIAAQTGISGSTVIEDYAVIGGQVGFGDHARVQKGAIIGSKAGILPGKIVRSGEVYWGVPVRPLREYKRLNALFGRLPEMKAEIDTLKKELAKLQVFLKRE